MIVVNPDSHQDHVRRHPSQVVWPDDNVRFEQLPTIIWTNAPQVGPSLIGRFFDFN